MQSGIGIEMRVHPITNQTILQPVCGLPVSSHLRVGQANHRASQSVSDLRVRKSRHLSEQIAARAVFLPPVERLLVEQLFVQGWRAARIAALTGEPTRNVRRRAKRLGQRLLSSTFDLVALYSRAWAPELRAVGELVFIRGRSANAAAAELGISRRCAQGHARTIRAMATSARREQIKRGAA